MMQALTSISIPLNNNISFYAISTRNTSLAGYLTIPTVVSIFFKDMSNLFSQRRIQLQANNGNVFDVGGSTFTLNTNNQSGHMCSIGKGSNGTLLQLN